jgi:hypothetical protein
MAAPAWNESGGDIGKAQKGAASMVYEARHSATVNYGLIAACLLLSVLGFAAAGVIPTQSGAYPAVGWGIVAACFAAAALFLLRARDRNVQARADAAGVYARRYGGETVAWDRIESLTVLRAGIQRIARFKLKDGKTLGINTTFYDSGIKDLLAAVRAYRPDLA